MTKITTYNRGIIIDGHADTKEECETITLLCDSLAKDKNFKQVAYDDGYAAFQKIGKAERLRFAPIPKNILTIIFDTGIQSVGFSHGSNTHTFTTSGEQYEYVEEPGADIVLTANLKSGYSLKSAPLGGAPIDNAVISGNTATIPENGIALTMTCTLVSEVATVKKSVDLTTLPGWANLSSGNHTIKIKAKGTGYRESELSAGVVVSKAASTVTIEKGTYQFVDSLALTSIEQSIEFTSNSQSFVKIVRQYDNRPTPNVNQMLYYKSDNTYKLAYGLVSDDTADWTNNAYKTITLATDQQVSQEFYKWAITDGNLVKQTGYNLTINYSTVPMSTGAAYIKINSDTVSSSNYDYVVQPGTSSTNPTLKNSVGTTLTVPYVVPNVEKVAFMGGLAIYVGGSTNNTSPYTLTADTTISPGVYGPTADTPIDEPTI